VTLKYGFYNSLDGDRRYDAEDISEVFNTILNDGVMKGFGDQFKVTALGGLTLSIGSGRAWFKDTWTNNTDDLIYTAETADAANPRIDTIVLRMNSDPSVRANSIVTVKGTPAATPQKSVLQRTATVEDYAIAYVTRRAGVATVAQSEIVMAIGTDTPFATSRLIELTYDTLVMRRNTFRGKNLGTGVSAAQSDAIRSGTFDDLYIGDYWRINGHNWRIADIDYYYGLGYPTKVTTHHVIVVPDASIMRNQMNTTKQASGGLLGSNYYKNVMPLVRTAISAAFSSAHQLNVSMILSNDTNIQGMIRGVGFYAVPHMLMNHFQVFGFAPFGPAYSGDFVPQNFTESVAQVPLFRLAPKYMVGTDGNPWWLRDPVSWDTWGAVGDGNNNAMADFGSPTLSQGIRPFVVVR
jgi:hypothetical protein